MSPRRAQASFAQPASRAPERAESSPDGGLAIAESPERTGDDGLTAIGLAAQVLPEVEGLPCKGLNKFLARKELSIIQWKRAACPCVAYVLIGEPSMLRKFIPCLVLTAAACVPPSGPVAYVAPAPATGEGAFACAYRTINEMGFTVTNADRDAGFIAAEKYVRSGVTYHDALSVAIFQATGASGQTLRVTAMDGDRERDDDEPVSSRAPSAHGRAAARIVAETCAPGSTPVQQNIAAGYQVQARVTR